jgi:hypothetical protein
VTLPNEMTEAEFIEDMRTYRLDHLLDGYPCVQTWQIDRLLDIIDRQALTISGKTMHDAYNEGYGAAIEFVSTAYEVLGHQDVSAEVRNFHTPATSKAAADRFHAGVEETAKTCAKIAEEFDCLAYSNESLAEVVTVDISDAIRRRFGVE